MIATPAVDIRGGRCVQLVGGRPEDERVSLPDPVVEAERWLTSGFESLHGIDLDAALGDGDNLDVISEIAAATAADVQVGGGVRSDERAELLLGAGADRIIVGTRGVDDPEWLGRLAARHRDRIVLALDMRDGEVLRKGWTESTGVDIGSFLPTVAELPLAGILSTDVGREGRLEGIDRETVARVLASSPHPVWVSGGITTIAELEYLDAAGAAGVVLGMALYTETLNHNEVAARWGRSDAGRP